MASRGSGGFATYPQNFIWPAMMFPSAILLDTVLLLSRNALVTALVGGMFFAFAFWLANWAILAPFNQPVEYQGSLMTVADLQGFEYIRTSTPEYLRIIERGTFRLEVGVAPLLATFFAAFLSIVGFYIWWLIRQVGHG